MDFSTNNNFLFKTLTSSLNNGMFDLKGFLELLQINNDVNVQVKLFSKLSAYLMTNEADIDVIITHNSLYNKICNVLSNCPPRKATVMFNFLSALLYAIDEGARSRAKTLGVYAKNMIRSSGCLSIMCELFTSCMMHQDVWRSLCRCLAEACQSVEANQSYCTHLVPMCIQKCSQRNLEVFMVLQSLLQNHARNISLFTECNGISLFQREFLQHDVCLQLLSTLVQSSTEVIGLVNGIGITQQLRDYLNSYGPQTQIGQWATIILFYITGTKVSSEIVKCEKQMIENIQVDKPVNTSAAVADLEFSADTSNFFQNVMREIVQCSPPSDLKYLRDLLPIQSSNTRHHLNRNNFQKRHFWASKENITRCNFSPPQNDLIQHEATRNKVNNLTSTTQKKNNTTIYKTEDKTTESLQRTIETKLTNSRQSFKTMNINNSHNTPEVGDFKPKFASTPKKNYVITRNSIAQRPPNRKLKSDQYSIQKRKLPGRVVKKIFQNPLERSTVYKENKHRSMSARFFDAINDSCTTLVKTVKNIFRPKNNSEATKEASSPISDTMSCSYSFTNYMRKRDAILKNNCTKSNICYADVSKESFNSCNTCNDTVLLKRKLAHDEYLKQTVRKLKVGINLYGCDFKKISKQLWPQQTYMTPVVLYNLYRKLLTK